MSGPLRLPVLGQPQSSKYVEERPHESEADEMETQTEEIVEMPVPPQVKKWVPETIIESFLNICLCLGQNS